MAELDIIEIVSGIIDTAIHRPFISYILGPTLVDTGLDNLSTQELFVQCTTSECTKARAEGGKDRKDGGDCSKFECIHQEQHNSPIATVPDNIYRNKPFERPSGKDIRFVTWG